MPVYTVHAQRAADQNRPSGADKFVFVRDGFHFWAFVAGMFWLAYHRLWLALLGYILLSFAGEVTLSLLGVSATVRILVMLMVALLMGFEASSLRRWTLSRRKWQQLDVIVADNEEAAERRFFDRWAASRAAPAAHDDHSIDRGAPPPPRSNYLFMAGPARQNPEIIGLFPQPGASR